MGGTESGDLGLEFKIHEKHIIKERDSGTYFKAECNK